MTPSSFDPKLALRASADKIASGKPLPDRYWAASWYSESDLQGWEDGRMGYDYNSGAAPKVDLANRRQLRVR